MSSYACQTLICIEGSGILEEGRSYYCFAETEHALWIHAPWLIEVLGVNQVKIPIALKHIFVLKK